MRFLFIYPNSCKFGTFHIGIGILSSILKKYGHVVDLFDTTFIPEGCEEYEFEKKVIEFKPDMLGFSVKTVDCLLAEKLYDRVAKMNIPAVVGGHHATLEPESTAKKFGMVLRGECEIALPLLLDKFSKGESVLDTPNLYLKKGDIFIKNDLAPLFENLDELPFPDWKLFDKRNYFESPYLDSALEGSKCLGVFEKSRGCFFSCSFCSIPKEREIYEGKGEWHREKSANRLADEILAFKELYPLDAIHFIDDIFLSPDKNKMAEFRDVFKTRVKIHFTSSERAERIDPDLMQMFKDTGGYQLWIGIESGDEELRIKMLNRRMSDETLIKAFQIAKECGVKTRATSMLGLPNQNEESYLKSYDLAGKAKPDSIQ
ncbi:MAG: radical SAM protein [Patescibacteria group bacterium]